MFDGLHHPFMVTGGTVYYCYTNITYNSRHQHLVRQLQEHIQMFYALLFQVFVVLVNTAPVQENALATASK